MLNPLFAAQKAAPQPLNTFLLVQEIVDEANYVRLTDNMRNLHTVCVGGSDKVRLIFSDDPPATLSEKVFNGMDPQSKVVLMLLASNGFSPECLQTSTVSTSPSWPR